MKLTINGEAYEVPAQWQDASLISVLRDCLGLTGTKFGCGKGICGACTVHLAGQPIRSCTYPVASAANAPVTTIEGLAGNDKLHPIQQAWSEYSVPQCGYCQPGQMMTAAAFLAGNGSPSIQEVTAAMQGNLCRCGTYSRIRLGVLRAAEIMRESN